MSDLVSQIADIKGRTWQEAFYLQTKAFLEKNSEHIKEIERLKAEVEMLKGQVNYWKIEAECDHGRWLRCLEDLEKLRASSFVTAVPCEVYEKLKAENEVLQNRCDFLEGRGL